MPQFDLANFVPQLVWLTIFFAILYFGIVRLTLPKVDKVMAAREDKVSGDLAEAEKAKADADGIAETHAAELASAHEQALASLNEARNAAKLKAEKKLAAANIKLDKKLEAAAAELASARDSALGTVGTLASELAGDIVGQLTGKRPDDAASKAAATKALGN